MKIEIRKSAIKDLKAIHEPFKSKLHDKILELKNFPNLSNIKKLTNFEPAYRLRVGDYRVLFDIIDDTIIIGRVLHRQNSYE
ncbi:MAG: type II toxin-antitoxin system RelE/ParE family toxin [Epsilonproteobacteria bacterium]|nr:type II toxin-antitoxin system RelE/ParE family toxin [Campylobacterota bacterium]